MAYIDELINVQIYDGEIINYQNKVINLFFMYDDFLKRNILSNYILPSDNLIKREN